MEKKKLLKKLGLIIILIAIICGIVFVIINSSAGKKDEKINANSAPISKADSQENNIENEIQEDNIVEEIVEEEIETKSVTKTELADGVKYSVSDEEITPEIVLGDNFFDTQIRDISLNFDQYEGKTIEIEGLYFENEPFTFVGRYSTSNMCPTCPTGYSYFEYEWNGDEKFELTDSENWIKVVGTLKRGFDGEEYFYIDAQSISLMNEKGLETVSN